MGLILLILIGYLLGSIPTAVWVGKRFYGLDVRNEGSGNAGATNTFRVLGKKAGIIVLSVDLLKGLAAGLFPMLVLQMGLSVYVSPELARIIGGASAVIGHIFPIFANFKGGKGVATSLGMAFAVFPLGALICALLFVVILTITKYVSVGSMLSALAFPIIEITSLFDSFSLPVFVFGSVIFVLVVFTHIKNIKRLITNTENKTYLWGKPK